MAREMYDYEKDPLETEKIISDKENRKNVEQLETMMLHFLKIKDPT